MAILLTHQTLAQLLQRRNTDPIEADALDAQIQAVMECYAVMNLDMSGFSRLTIQYGIIHFLAMIQRLVGIVTPIVRGQKGTVFKQEADNVFAVFPSVPQAVDASMKILDALTIANHSLPANQALYASIGIGYGDLIPIFRNDELCDVFGNEMNLASKLGEDLAEPSEVLLTAAAHQHLQSSAYTGEPRTVTISKVDLVTYSVARTFS